MKVSLSFVGNDNSPKLGLDRCEPDIDFTNPTAGTIQGRQKQTCNEGYVGILINELQFGCYINT